MKRLLLLFVSAVLLSMPAMAVLKEKDLTQTVAVLRTELEATRQQQQVNLKLFKEARKRMRKTLLEQMKTSDQISLMLMSQNQDYVFDLAYACHEATNLYFKFSTRVMPFNKWIGKMSSEIARYESLIAALERMPDAVLTDEARRDRNACVDIALGILNQMKENQKNLTEMKKSYDRVHVHLKELHEYAKKRYQEIQNNIFVNGDTDYFTILMGFRSYKMQADRSITTKYSTSKKAKSEWKGIALLNIFIYVFVFMSLTVSISYLILRFCVPKRLRTQKFIEFRSPLSLTISFALFAVMSMVLNVCTRNNLLGFTRNFYIMASELLIEYSWLLVVVFLSLLIRMRNHPKDIKNAFRIYAPVFVIGFVVIAFRIIFIPNEVVSLIFAPIILFVCIWQYIAISKHQGFINRSDIFYAWAGLVVLVVATVSSFRGYTLLAVQLLIWWYMQLTCIQSVTCIYELLSIFEKKKLKGANNIKKTWWYDFIYMTIVPVLGVYSILISIYWSATVFDMTEFCMELFFRDIVNVQGIVRISLVRIVMVITLFFCFRFVIYVCKSIYFELHRKKYGNDKSVLALGTNIATIFCWGIYVIVCMKILEISDSGIIVALGGLSTGLGFAMKDTLENLFYGISLMTGRVRVGDIIELDGIRGRVDNINYQATMVETLDGSIMAFLNSQLFTKNFKNLTRNHGLEVAKISVGIAYGTSVDYARQVIVSKLSALDCYSKKEGIKVLLDNFGDNSVDLTLILWVPVLKKLTAVAAIKECVYSALNEARIEIPFPQRDIYIKQMPEA